MNLLRKKIPAPLLESESSRVRREGYMLGQRDELDRVIKLFVSWAVTHPDSVVADELWGFVEKLRGSDEA